LSTKCPGTYSSWYAF